MNIINSQQHIKDLGVTMWCDCSFYQHIDLKIKQCRQLTGWILRTFKARVLKTVVCPIKTKKYTKIHIRVQYIFFIEIQEIYTIIQWLYTDYIVHK